MRGKPEREDPMSRDEARTRTRDIVLVDQVRRSPVDSNLSHTRRKILCLLVIAVVLVVVALVAWRFTADRPVDSSSDADHFKYGSIGSEPGGPPSLAIGVLLPPYEI